MIEIVTAEFLNRSGAGADGKVLRRIARQKKKALADLKKQVDAIFVLKKGYNCRIIPLQDLGNNGPDSFTRITVCIQHD